MHNTQHSDNLVSRYLLRLWELKGKRKRREKMSRRVVGEVQGGESNKALKKNVSVEWLQEDLTFTTPWCR